MSEAKVLYHDGSPHQSGPVVVLGRATFFVGVDTYDLYVRLWEWRRYGKQSGEYRAVDFHVGADVVVGGGLGSRYPHCTHPDAAAIRWGIQKYDELAAIEEWPEEETEEEQDEAIWVPG